MVYDKAEETLELLKDQTCIVAQGKCGRGRRMASLSIIPLMTVSVRLTLNPIHNIIPIYPGEGKDGLILPGHFKEEWRIESMGNIIVPDGLPPGQYGDAGGGLSAPGQGLASAVFPLVPLTGLLWCP